MEHITYLTALPAIASIYSWIAKYGTAVVGAFGVAWAIPAYVLTRNAGLYANFDTLYQSVLQLGMGNPAFRDTAKTLHYKRSFEADQRAAYEAYAFMVLNVCETIADGLNFYDPHKKGLLELAEASCCWSLPPSAHRAYLRQTWLPVLIAEKEMHAAWLNDQQDGVRFKAKFLNLMRSDLLALGRECGGQVPAAPGIRHSRVSPE